MRTFERIDVSQTPEGRARGYLLTRVENTRLSMVAESGRRVVASPEFRREGDFLDCECFYDFDGRLPPAEEETRKATRLPPREGGAAGCLEELWGALALDCGPSDYPAIVKQVIARAKG